MNTPKQKSVAPKQRPARGTIGFLSQDIDGLFYFRVYRDNSFQDYDICHKNLKIQIIDEDAMFKNEEGKRSFIDYSNKTLDIE